MDTTTTTTTTTTEKQKHAEVPLTFCEFRRMIIDNRGNTLMFDAVKCAVNCTPEKSRAGIERYHVVSTDTAELLPIKQVYRKLLNLSQDIAEKNALYLRFVESIETIDVPDNYYADFTLEMDKKRNISAVVFVKIFELFRKKFAENFSIKETEGQMKVNKGTEKETEELVTRFYFKVDEKNGNITFRIFGVNAKISKKAIADFKRYQQSTAK